MKRTKSKASRNGDVELSALMKRLRKTGQRLEELTGGEVDTLVDGDGRILYLRGTQEQLKQSENARRAAILNALHAHIALLDAKGVIIAVNDAWKRFGILNVTRGSGGGVGLNYLEICDHARGDGSSEAHIAADGIRSVLNGAEKTFSIEYPGTSQTEEQWFLLTATSTVYGHQNGAIVICEDISSRKQAESAHRILTERLSLATAVAKVGVWEWNVTTNAFTWDATMFEIYGFVPVVPTIQYEQWSATVYPEDLPAVETILREVIDQKEDRSAEFRITRADGASRNVMAMERAVLDKRANVTRVIGVNIDITERKIAAKSLEESRNKQLRLKDEFLSHVSHELRSPLTAIKQFTSILLEGLAGALENEQIEFLHIIMKNILQLQAMIDDLLEITHLEAGRLTLEPRSTLVAGPVTDSVGTLALGAKAKGLTLSCDLPSGLPSVYADPTRLRQILIILLDNAVKFTSEGGAVKVQARLWPDDPRFVLLEVSDTGSGMTPEEAEKSFDRLFQVRGSSFGGRKGLGLGLYICKELVTRQGGKIWVRSQPEEGSVFSFTLPIFSLSNIISPLLKDDKWPAESVALVRVETRFRGARPSKVSQSKQSQVVHDLVARCVLPDLDVLLPKESGVAENECLFVVAFAEEKGVSVLAERIRGQFERLPEATRAGLAISVSYTMVNPIPPKVAGSEDNIVARLTTKLAELMQSRSMSESIQ